MGEVTAQDYDVLISGGGPVGMALAIELGQRGHSVAVVEKYPSPQPIPKGQNLTQRTMEHMRAWGVEDEMRRAAPIPRDFGIGGVTAYGTLADGPAHDWLIRAQVGAYYYAGNERLPQYATEAVLRARVAELENVRVFYGYETRDVTQDAGGVTLTAEARKGGEALRLTGRWLAGCDGSRSVVREAAGIPEIRREHDKLMVLLVFRSPKLNEVLQRFPAKSYFNVLQRALEGYWLFFGRVDTADTFFFHAPVPAGTTEDNYDFHALLEQAVGRPVEAELQHVGFWDLRIAYAERYRAGRVFVAGDAAHSHPPYGGYGINTGFEDARNLGWKLSMVLSGAAPEGLLDSYDAERRPVFASTARDFIESAIEADRAFTAKHDPQADPEGFARALEQRREGSSRDVDMFEPHYEGSPVVDGPAGGESSARGGHLWRARPGHHLPPRMSAEGWRSDERLGPEFTLLAIGAEAEAVARARRALSGMPVRVEAAAAAAELPDYEARWILLRPDHYVAWRGDVLPEDPATPLAMALGR